MFIRMSYCMTRFCLLLFALIMLKTANAAEIDRLYAPALHTQGAQGSLLLDVVEAGNRVVAVGEQGIVLISDDAGISWRQAEVPVSVLLTAITFTDESTGWAVGHDGVVLKTIDGGENWRVALTGAKINQLRVSQLEWTLKDSSDLSKE